MPLLRTFGRLALDGTELTRPQPLLLLAYLALEGPVSREHVAQLFWPNQDRGRKNLSMALSRLREHLEIELRDDGEMLSTLVPSDAGRFVDAFLKGDLREAVRWYEGPFLPEAPGDAGGPELETWVLEQRDRFAFRACRAHLDLGVRAAGALDSTVAAGHGELALRLVRRHGLVEPDLVADLHRLLRRSGSPGVLETAGLLEELGIDADDGEDPGWESRLLPHVQLVGRDEDVERIWATVTSPDAALVTVTGPAGVGKTSLALAVAHRATTAPEFPDGVRFVSLEASRTRPEVLGRLAGALGVADAGDSLGAVIAALQDRRILVVMDNFEHVLGAAKDVGRILAAVPGTRILATSRTRLQLRSEREVPLEPLETHSGASVRSSDSAELFVARVRSSDRSYRPGPAELATIEEICRRLDGLPLAIELAAAHGKAFELQEIRAMLDDRFELLRGGFRDAPERQGSLLAAVDWSYQLLDEEQKRLFRHLAVLRGSFDLGAAAHVLGVSRAEAAAGLRVLVDHHLVKSSSGRAGVSRFHLLETLRAYAARRLTQAAERTEAERANAQRLAALAGSAARHLTGSERSSWTERLSNEADNLRGALAWCVDAGARDLGLRIATGAWRYWVSRGELREARTWLEAFVPDLDDLDPRDGSDGGRASDHRELVVESRRALATVFHELGSFAEARQQLEGLLDVLDAEDPRREAIAVDRAWVLTHLGELDLAEDVARAARAEIDAASDPRLAALADNDLGWSAAYRGAWAEAEGWFRSSLELRGRAGDERGTAFAEVNTAWAAVRGLGTFGPAAGRAGGAARAGAEDTGPDRLRGALARCEAAERALLEMGDAQLTAWAGTVRAELLTACGRFREAADRAEAAVEAWRRVGNMDGLALAHEALAGALLAAGRAGQAAAAAVESVTIRDDTHNAWGMARVRIQLGLAAVETGDREGAATRFREALELATALGNPGFMELCRYGLDRSLT